KGLEVRGHIEFAAMVASYKHFTNVNGAPFWRNGPQNVSEVFITKGGRSIESAEFHLDFHRTAFALYFCLPCRCRHQIGAAEIDFCCAAAVRVLDGTRRAADHARPMGARLIRVHCVLVLSLC